MLFADEARAARDALRDGWSVRFVGPRGSGRSRLLEDVADALERAGTAVIRCHGELAAEDSPGYGLGRLAAELGVVPRARELSGTIDELAAAVPAGAVLAIDDPHVLDPLSRRGIATIRARLGLRAILTERAGMPHEARFPQRWPERVIRVPHLDLAATGALAGEVLGSAVAPLALSRVFAKTGGSPLLVTALLQSARARGLLRERAGSWTQTGYTLWTEDLAPLVDELLADADPRVRALVVDLASHGDRAMDEAEATHGTAVVERAREGGRVRIGGAAGAPTVAAWPPLLADRFGRGVRPIVAVHTAKPVGVPAWCGDPDQLSALARRFLDHAIVETERTLRAWREQPTVANALAFYGVASGDPRRQDELHRVLTTTTPRPSDDGASNLLFAFAHAQWIAFQEHDVERATSALADYGALHPAWAESAEAAAVLVGVIAGRGAGAVPSAPQRPADDPTGLRVAAVLLASLANGRLADAKTLAEGWGGSARGSATWGMQLIPLLEGDARESLRRSAAALDEGERSLDRTVFSSAAYSAVLAHHYLGEYHALQQSVDAAVLVGRPRLEYTPTYTACLNIQGMIALFSGRAAAKDSFLGEADALMSQPGPFLGMGADSYRAVDELAGALASDGRATDAAFAAAVRRRTELGYVVGAVQTAAGALALGIGPQTVAAFREALALRPLPAFSTAGELADLLVHGADIGRIEAVLRQPREAQDDGLLRALLASAARQAADEDPGRSSALRGLAHEVLSERRVGDVGDLTRRVTPPASALTPREHEIALLAGALANREIAERLHLSVRTVENHLSAAMRKTGARDRGELFRLADREPSR